MYCNNNKITPKVFEGEEIEFARHKGTKRTESVGFFMCLLFPYFTCLLIFFPSKSQRVSRVCSLKFVIFLIFTFSRIFFVYSFSSFSCCSVCLPVLFSFIWFYIGFITVRVDVLWMNVCNFWGFWMLDCEVSEGIWELGEGFLRVKM